MFGAILRRLSSAVDQEKDERELARRIIKP
jgi:hypothetical protein